MMIHFHDGTILTQTIAGRWQLLVTHFPTSRISSRRSTPSRSHSISRTQDSRRVQPQASPIQRLTSRSTAALLAGAPTPRHRSDGRTWIGRWIGHKPSTYSAKPPSAKASLRDLLRARPAANRRNSMPMPGPRWPSLRGSWCKTPRSVGTEGRQDYELA